MNVKDIAQALERCDWSGVPIGNKAVVQAAVDALRVCVIPPEGWRMVPPELTPDMHRRASPYVEGDLMRGYMWSDLLDEAPRQEECE